MQNHTKFYLLFLLVSIVSIVFFYIISLGSYPLFDPDGALHAQIAKEMLKRGDLITPTFLGKPFFDKPILYFWTEIISFKIFGIGEFSARFPSFLFGIFTSFITYMLAKEIFSDDPKKEEIAYISSVSLASSSLFFVLSRIPTHDMALTFFVTLALFSFLKFYKTKKALSLFLFYTAMGAGILTKGPLGVVLPCLVIFVFLSYKRKLSFLSDLYIGYGLVYLLIIAGIWYIPMSLKNPHYLSYFILKKNIGSFLSSSSRHPRPIYYYFFFLPLFFFPYTVFFPVSVYFGIKDKLVFPLFWFLSIFFFFSFAKSKLPTYILPTFPPLCILFSYAILSMDKKSLTFHSTAHFLLFISAIFFALFAKDRFLPSKYIEINPLILSFCLISLLPFLSIFIKDIRIPFFILAFLSILSFSVYSLPILNFVSKNRSYKDMAISLNRFRKDVPILFFKRPPPSLVFYMRGRKVYLKDRDIAPPYLIFEKCKKKSTIYGHILFKKRRNCIFLVKGG